MTEPVVLRVTRHFEASPERVFDAWLDPAQVGQFLFATPGGRSVRVEVDAHEMSPEWAGYVDRSRAGWTMILETLGNVLTA